MCLPKNSIKDPERCFNAGVPLEKQALQRKAKLGLDLIKEAIENGTSFLFVGIDPGDGRNSQLLETFDHMKITWFTDVAKTHLIYKKMQKIEV